MNINQGIIFHDWNSYSAQRKMLGLSQLSRTILVMINNGLQKIIIVSEIRDQDHEKRIRRELEHKWTNQEIIFTDFKDNFLQRIENNHPDRKILFVRSSTVFDPQLIQKFDEQSGSPDSTIFCTDKTTIPNSGMLILSAPVRRIINLTMRHRGKERMDEYIMCSLMSTATPLSQSEMFCINVESGESWKRARKHLLQTARKKSDGWVYRNLNRPLSLFMTKYILKTGITPNTISILNLLPGLMSAVLITSIHPFLIAAAGLLFQLSSIFDGCDGENARLTFRFSDKGAQVDTACDIIVYFAFLIALPIGLSRRHPGGVYFYLGILTVVSVIFLYLNMITFLRIIDKSGSMVHIITAVKKDAEEKNSILAKILAFGSSLLRRDLFSIIFMFFCLFNMLEILQIVLASSAPIAALLLMSYNIRKKNIFRRTEKRLETG